MAFLARWTKKLIEIVLEQLIPVHMKRIIFLITLYRMSRNNHDLTDAELAELNSALALAKTDAAALHFPMRIAESIGLQYETPITSCGPKDLETIIERTPSWLRYGRTDDLLKDLGNLKQFAAAHPA